MNQEESDYVAHLLPGEVHSHIGEFVNSAHVAATSKLYLKAAEVTAEKILLKIQQNHYVGDVSDWRSRLAKHVINSFYSRVEILRHAFEMLRHADPPDPAIFSPRLLVRSAKEIPLSVSVCRVPHHWSHMLGPVAVLPNGNLAFYCRDCCIRIFDSKRGRFHRERRVIADEQEAIDVSFCELCSSKEHLVLRACVNSVSVWKLDDLSFVCDIQVGEMFSTEDAQLAVAPVDGETFWSTWIQIWIGFSMLCRTMLNPVSNAFSAHSTPRVCTTAFQS